MVFKYTKLTDFFKEDFWLPKISLGYDNEKLNFI